MQKIVATETEARQRVQAAGAEAEKILSEAQKRGREVVDAAWQSARREADEVPAGHLGQPQPFYLEVALDCGYFQELLAKISRLSGEDQTVVRPLGLYEANFFQFMLATRGRFHFDLPADVLLPLHPRGILEDWFKNLLAASDKQLAWSLQAR